MAVYAPSKMWAAGQTLSYRFLPGVPQPAKDAGRKAARRLASACWVTFVEVEGPAIVRIAADPDHPSGPLWALLGRDAQGCPEPGPTMNLAFAPDATPERAYAAALHEWTHGLGYGHATGAIPAECFDPAAVLADMPGRTWEEALSVMAHGPPYQSDGYDDRSVMANFSRTWLRPEYRHLAPAGPAADLSGGDAARLKRDYPFPQADRERAYVRLQYRLWVRRDCSEREIDGWVPVLRERGRDEVVRMFAGSLEARGYVQDVPDPDLRMRAVANIYVEVLGRTMQDRDWLAWRDNPAALVDVRRAVAASEEAFRNAA
jgi:hypothetical protein